ncbi:hypothetical protein ACJX0J_038511, partial [Zea mays]
MSTSGILKKTLNKIVASCETDQHSLYKIWNPKNVFFFLNPRNSMLAALYILEAGLGGLRRGLGLNEIYP